MTKGSKCKRETETRTQYRNNSRFCCERRDRKKKELDEDEIVESTGGALNFLLSTFLFFISFLFHDNRINERCQETIRNGQEFIRFDDLGATNPFVRDVYPCKKKANERF